MLRCFCWNFLQLLITNEKRTPKRNATRREGVAYVPYAPCVSFDGDKKSVGNPYESVKSDKIDSPEL